jgi:cell pole-organizing protein PopZ
MSRYERDHTQQIDPPVDGQRDAPEPSHPNSDAEDSAAHIAELVRRTAERHAAPSPSCIARPDVMVEQQPPVPTPSVARPVAKPARPAMPRPSRLMLVTAGGVVAVLIGVGVALSHPFATVAGPSASVLRSPTPAGYAVKVTDEITDCTQHAHGRTKHSFGTQNCMKATRSLATGQVSGRPALFVISHIQMASAEAAASVKQVLDSSGTGNLNDLLREGRSFPGAPSKMPDSGYASVQTGQVVSVAEAGFVDSGRSSSTDASLRAAAAQVASLVTPAS